MPLLFQRRAVVTQRASSAVHDKESRISTLQSFRENSFRERGPTVAVALQAENRPSTTVGVHHNQAQAFLKVKLLETPVPRSKCCNVFCHALTLPTVLLLQSESLTPFNHAVTGTSRRSSTPMGATNLRSSLHGAPSNLGEMSRLITLSLQCTCIVQCIPMHSVCLYF